MPLLTIDKLIDIRRISTTFNQDRFDSFAKEADDVHLRLLLGDSLYLDLINNTTDAKYITLLNGEDYVKSGETVRYFGLYPFLSYAWLFINSVEGSEFQSNIGTVQFNQQNQNTNRPPNKSSGKKYQDSMIIYRNNIIDYLNCNKNTYTLWKGNDKENRGKFSLIHL